MQRLTIDPVCGLAGDMLSAAFISAGVPGANVAEVMSRAAAALGGARVRVKNVERCSLQGVLLEVTLLAPPHSTAAGEIREALEAVCREEKLASVYRDFALRALDLLIEAEHHAHSLLDSGEASEHHHHCHLHEAQDILLDIAGAAFCAQWLGVDLSRVVCLSPVMTGSGQIRFSHGIQPVPAPAVSALIEKHGIPVAPGEMRTELLTPTGAALLAAFQPTYLERKDFQSQPKADVSRTGTGFGTKDLSAQFKQPNAVSIYLG